MLTVAIRKQISQNNMKINELKSFIGKNVLITITEEQNEAQSLDTFSAFFNLAGQISIDEESISELREN